ncbi:MAG: SDR family NAD(P)-dependent oxidoreductase [Paracoccaceae bacterium]
MDRNWQGKTYWLVGASEGLGRALAHVLSRAGIEVIVSARSRDRLEELVDELPGRARAVPVDVTDTAAVAKAAAEVGPVDGVIYLAGLYWPMTAQEWDEEKVEAMGQVNYLGCTRVCGAVLPDMIARDRGHVVLVGSLSAYRGLPGAIGYAASKAGVMALGESMQIDLQDTGVRVQIANPGFIRTRLTDKNDFSMPGLMEPEPAAQEIFELMNSPAGSKSFPFGFGLLFRGSRFLPDWAYNRAFKR